MMRGLQHTALAEKVRDRVPEETGVYLLHGEHDEILYIGKAVNLRQRILSHLRFDPQGDEPRHSRLVYQIRDVEYQTTASELLALLREDALIKKHRPRFNVRQNEIEEYKYLELTADEFPRLRMVDHETDFGGRRVFGPYRDRYLADDILRLVHHYLGLRSCTDADPVGKCLEFDLGHCAGPCRDGVSRQDYGRVVERSTVFLNGEVSEVMSGLERAMNRASDKLEFEKAQELKERIEFCRRFGDRQRFLRAFRERRLIVVEAGNPGLAYLFDRGRLVAHGTKGEVVTDARDGIPPTPEDPVDDPRVLLDRATIVHGWLRRNADRCTHRFSDPHLSFQPEGSLIREDPTSLPRSSRHGGGGGRSFRKRLRSAKTP
jgi:excinuclease ABC subunit C